jgi:hypothetical protein
MPTEFVCVSVCIAKQTVLTDWLFGAFRKLRKTAVSFVISVRTSARMEQLVSHWMDFR